MNALTNQLENCGLKLKLQKCRAVHLLKNGTTDEMYVATKPVIRVALARRSQIWHLRTGTSILELTWDLMDRPSAQST